MLNNITSHKILSEFWNMTTVLSHCFHRIHFETWCLYQIKCELNYFCFVKHFQCTIIFEVAKKQWTCRIMTVRFIYFFTIYSYSLYSTKRQLLILNVWIKINKLRILKCILSWVQSTQNFKKIILKLSSCQQLNVRKHIIFEYSICLYLL